MANELTDSIFQSSSIDRIKVTDPTSVKDNGTISVPSISMKGIFKTVVDNIRPAVGAASEVARMVEQSKYYPINRAQMLDRALSAMGTSFPSVINQLGDKVKGFIDAPLVDIITDSSSKVFESIIRGDVYSHTGNSMDAYEVFGMAQDLLGNEDIQTMINMEAETAAVAGILNSVVEAGMPELIDDVLGMTESERVRRDSMGWLSTRAIGNGNLDVLVKAVEVSGALVIKENNPNFSEEVVSNYKYDPQTGNIDWSARSALLKDTMSKVDPEWNVTGEGLPKLSGYMNGSDDFNRTMTEGGSTTDKLMVMTAKAWDGVKSTGSNIINSIYPNTWIRNDRVELDMSKVINQNTTNQSTAKTIGAYDDRSIQVS